MQAMKRSIIRHLQDIAGMAVLVCALGCTPALNWRQVATDDAQVQLLLPCKPDQATRDVVLFAGGQEVSTTLTLQGCEAGGMQFTFGQMSHPIGVTSTEVLAAWRLASLAPLNASPGEALPEVWQLKGVDIAPPAVRTRVSTDTHQVQWVWFVHADKIYQAAVYGKPKDKGLPEAAETYFSGIQVP